MGADILGKCAWGSLFKSRPFKVVTGLAGSDFLVIFSTVWF